MVDILSVSIVIATSLATLTNVVLVAKRYKYMKDMKDAMKTAQQINIASDKLKDASNILNEIKIQNHGVSPLDSGQKEQIQKLIEEINCQVKSTDSQVM